MIRILFLLSLFLFSSSLISQINYSANDTIVPYDGFFRFGINPGAHEGWRDEQLADISAGNPDLGIEGIGINTFRPALPEWFLDFWGYDIRIDAFQHYDNLGIRDNTVFIGYPSEEHREIKQHCPGTKSQVFENLYEPIWDDGANGTPVNEANYYAIYTYQMVQKYGDYVQFWEIWNEPDFSFVVHSVTPPGTEKSWWDENPQPCDYALRAPIFQYIRMMRISYEVIKSLYPNAYITTGGLGYPSYLDAILRNTDNPVDGSVTPEYPLKGGAYFDVLSYHSYPHIDNSLRYWSNDINGFAYTRHSDRAVEGLIDLKYEFQVVLESRGYDDVTYPAKKWIITEANIPRVEFKEFIGSPEAQRNFLIKSVVACQQHDILQFHPFNLSDLSDFDEPENEFHTMGMYRQLKASPPYEQIVTDAGIAYKTASDLLFTKRYDASRTAALNLPNHIQGGAFRDSLGSYTYVLWTETEDDQSERAFTTFSFQFDNAPKFLQAHKWDFSRSGRTAIFPSREVRLSGSPIILTEAEGIPDDIRVPTTLLYPNPFLQQLNIELELPKPVSMHIELLDARGVHTATLLNRTVLTEGVHQLDFNIENLASGAYFLKIAAGDRLLHKKVIH